jgi:hypothetical protein
MSKSILSMQVPPQAAAPRAAATIGLCAGVLCVTLRDLARAVSAVLAHREERRHA